MIRVVVQPTFDDYLRAQRYHARSRTLLIAGLLGGMAALMWLASRHLIFPVAVALYVIVLRPIIHRFRLKRCWEQTPSAHSGQKTYGFDVIGLHWEDDEGNLSVTHWDKFLKFRESNHSFLLYFGPNLYMSLPKRFLSCEDRDAIRGLLRENIRQSHRSNPGERSDGPTGSL